MHGSTKWALLCGMIGLAVLGGLVLGVTGSGLPDDLEATAIIAAIAAVVGLPPTVAAFILLRRGRRRRALLAASGNHPWTLRDDWREGRVVANTPHELAFSWLVAAGLMALGAVLVFVVETKDETMDPIIDFLGWVLGAVAVVAFLLEVVHVRRRLVHGRPDLVLSEVPLVQGDRYSMEVRTDSRVTEPGDVIATVECTRIKGVGRDRRVTKLGSASFSTNTADSHMEIERTILPIEIALPEGLPDREDDEDPNVRWTLTVISDAFPARLKAVFELPVFRSSVSVRRDA